MPRSRNDGPKKLALTLYKIDISKGDKIKDRVNFNSDITNNNIHELIYAWHMYKQDHDLSSWKWYIQSNILNANFWESWYKISIYRTASWNEYVPDIANYFNGNTIDWMSWKTPPSTAVFIYNGDECYALSTWKWYVLFENFVDLDFPIAFAKRVMDPKVSNTTERDITGSIYARVQHFRNDQFIESQSIGTVWNTINWYISQDVYDSSEFQSIFNPDRSKVGIDVWSWVTIKRSIESDKIMAYFDWISLLMNEELTDLQKSVFSQLDWLSEINKRKSPSLFESLDKTLIGQIRYFFNQPIKIDFDFCHNNFQWYQSATSYEYAIPEIRTLIPAWEHQKSCDEIIKELHSNWFITITSDVESEETNIQTILEKLKSIQVVGVHDPITESTYASIFDHIHWEVRYDNISYFRIDWRWFKLDETFENDLASRFALILSNPEFFPSVRLWLDIWTAGSNDEWDYNETYKSKSDFLVWDRALYNQIELADLIRFEWDQVYIYHNKVGYDAAMRDVCSQALQWMTWIERIRKWPQPAIEFWIYYDTIIRRHYTGPGIICPISKDDFLHKMISTDSKNIIFIIGYAAPNPVAITTWSRIAKFETIKLAGFDRRRFDFWLKFVHIPR